MSYLIHSLNDPQRAISALTGQSDANPGQAAFSEDGDIYVMTNMGWQKVWDHVDGGSFPPDIPLPSNEAIVTDGGMLDIGSATGTIGVTDNAITGVTLEDTAAVVTDGQSIGVGTSTGTLDIAANAVTGVTLVATAALVTNGEHDIKVKSQDAATAPVNASADVASNAVVSLTLEDGAVGLVTNGQDLPVTGGTVTLSVAAGVVTAAYTADA